jgi:hypothetical protein
MSNDENGWSEYSKLVLKELETLAKGIDSLKTEIGEIKQELIVMKNHANRIDELQAWKGRVDDVASPTQLKEHIDTIAELRSFKTKAVTVFAVIQFLMAFALFTQSMWS